MWWSASLQVICLIEGHGLDLVQRNVVVFRAPDDWASAWSKAIELAERYRQEYQNGEGRHVRWVPKAIETLDMFDAEFVSGQEVYSEMQQIEPPDTSVPFDISFDLTSARPGMSGSGVYARK